MAYFDLSLEQLKTYQAGETAPADFGEFWDQTLAAARSHALNPVFQKVETGLKLVDVYDVTFAGYGGQPVKGWLILPSGVQEPLPCVVQYIGYGGGRGHPIEWLAWANAGFAHFVMDTRGQGSTGRQGHTPDIPDAGSSPHVPGFMTLGVLDPLSYYYRRVYTDGVRAVEAARSHPSVDPDRVAVTGGSQGGGITIAVAGLDASIPVMMPDVPFLCHFSRAVTLVDSYPYAEITKFCRHHRDLVDTVFNTLAYFDGIHFAPRARGSALFSVGLMDTICPPSTVFAAYNVLGVAQKDITIWTFNEHEGGGVHHDMVKIQYLLRMWGGENS